MYTNRKSIFNNYNNLNIPVLVNNWPSYEKQVKKLAFFLVILRETVKR